MRKTPVSKDVSVPGFPELVDWPVPPAAPLKLLYAERYRESDPQRGTLHLAIKSSNGHCFHFFFEKFLGRLCYGSHHDAPDAAYLKQGSDIEREAFELIERLASESDDYREVLECLAHARVWTPW